MRQIAAFLKSSIAQKIVMALTGLVWIGFLVAHLGGNLLLFVSRDSFNTYSHKLVTNPFIYLAELFLLVTFVGHFVSGLRVSWHNRRARPERYLESSRAGSPSRKSLASSTMVYTGIVVLAFVPLHLWTFKYGPHYDAGGGVRDLYRLVLEIFRQPLYVLWYVLAMSLIGFHLWHGFGSAFESLGVSYRKPLRRFGQLLAVLIAGGFLLIPLVIYFRGGGL